MSSLVDWQTDLVRQLTVPTDPIWEETPVDLDTFVENERFLGLPPLSAVQRYDLLQILGEDPKKVFAGGSDVNVGVLLWGKGSGKDYVCAIVQCYCIYLLLCMRHPAAYFKLAPVHWLDCINTSTSQGNALAVYHEYFLGMLHNWPWLRNRYSLRDGRGRMLELEGNRKDRYPLVIEGDEIEFKDKRIRAIAKGSDATFSEGYAPIVWTMSEASAFRSHTETMNAKKLYMTFQSSSITRYGFNWKGFIVSWPREKIDDFTVDMYNVAQEKQTAKPGEATMYGSRHATWEVRPEKYSGVFIDFNGLQIPKELEEQFIDEPEDCKTKLMCLPPEVASPFIEYPDRILECVNPKRLPLFLTETAIIEHEIKGSNVLKKYIGKRITRFLDKSPAARKLPRVAHVDCGLRRDNAGLVIAHGELIEIKVHTDEGKDESTYRYKVVVDAVIHWHPDKKQGLQVSINNIEAIISEVATIYNIVKVSYDQWNSQSSLELLQSKHIDAQEHTINDKDYKELRSMIYQNAVDLLPHAFELDGVATENRSAGLLYHELVTLKNLNGRVDHTKTGSKDTSDCLAGVNRLLNNPKEMIEARRPMPRSILGTAFSRAQAMPFSPAQAGITQPIPDGFGIPKSSTPMTGQVLPGYASYARSSQSKDGVMTQPEVKGYGSRMPRSMLTNSGRTPSSTTRSMSTLMSRTRTNIPSYLYK